MSKNVTRNVRIIGLEVRDLSSGTVVHKADTHPQPCRSSFSRSCLSEPFLHYALTSWCLYVTSFEALLVFSFVEIIFEGACFLHATSFENIRCFRMSRDLSKLHTTCWKNVSCCVTTTVFLRYIYPSIVFSLNLCSSVGDETCEETRTISLIRAFAFCISQSACKWSVFEQNWRWVSLCDLKFWQPWIGLIFFW
jgi:hypothetical protein